ncbi:MAG: N-acetylmuramoyl-L-alanine amidase [Fusobacteriaceae bacterium]
MPNIEKRYLTDSKSRPRTKLKGVNAIVVHWTANTNRGANALANAKYFDKSDNSSSAHYIVDSERILEIIPTDEVAYHCGSKSYTKYGESIKIKNSSPNHSTIGIEMCVNSDGIFAVTESNTLWLIEHLCDKFKLSKENVVRHYDITGKDCPKMYISSDSWGVFKAKINFKDYPKKDIRKVTASSLNVRVTPSTNASIASKLSLGESVEVTGVKDGWADIGIGFVSAQYLK